MTGTAITIGTFDGVHRGHRFLLSQLGEWARRKGLRTLALTFDRHPAGVVGRAEPPALCTVEEKRALLAELADGVEVMPFTPALARLSAYGFMRLLKEERGAELLLLGYDHRFGHPQEGDDYRRDARSLGIELHRAEPLAGVSSTAIRQALAEGRLAEANDLLGRPYRLTGTVVHGRHVGSTIGFPTANLSTQQALPRTGVYAGACTLGPCLINVGRRPTLQNGTDVTVEVHVPGFEGNLYGQPLSVSLQRRLRSERQFPDIDSLRLQIQNDIAQL
ncbi:MAG: riboflavin biosynthesis protein RibF [Bacteroidaceae bacterium]|nr:riboflavin biosynthesis protein RibF [Candidatus Equimonas faecalis]MCQ2205450.1 riboflavin biosynthesis protein RibF [Bacteroidaceae bacterium]